MTRLSNDATILVTGGAGFVGTNFIRHAFSVPEFCGRIVNADLLTYAGNPHSLDDINSAFGGTRYFFHRYDICDRQAMAALFTNYGIDAVVHFAAESHVDRSILGPESFVRTNVQGTFSLLETVRSAWADRRDVRFHHVSTDEVFGSLGATGSFSEDHQYDPRSPYSASKASSDHLVMAYHHTYGLPVTISNCSNNYGPYQFPEKLIPLMILNMLEGKPLPIYGDGRQVRNWLYVGDHVAAVWQILHQASSGARYNVGGEDEWENVQVVTQLCHTVAQEAGVDAGTLTRLVTHVRDRPGHDRRYSIDCGKIRRELGWRPSTAFAEGLDLTVRWYLRNRDWIEMVRSGSYRDWMETNYALRPAEPPSQEW